jgi:hypothetical protein
MDSGAQAKAEGQFYFVFRVELHRIDPLPPTPPGEDGAAANM